MRHRYSVNALGLFAVANPTPSSPKTRIAGRISLHRVPAGAVTTEPDETITPRQPGTRYPMP